MSRWVRRGAVAIVLVLAAAIASAPPPVRRAEAWVRYRVTGFVPPPIVVGEHDRLFLGNHAGGAAGSLIAEVCGTGVDGAAIARAAAAIQPVLAAGRNTGLPFRLVIVPTAPRLYPEDLPPGTPCGDPAADRLVDALHDPAVMYPLGVMQALKPRFDVLPRHHFHWAGEGPLRVVEAVAEGLGLPRQVTLGLRADNRASDLNGFYPGLGLHDRIGTPDLRAAGVVQCDSTRCQPPLPPALVAFARSGPGRILLVADSFGDEAAGNFAEYAGQVWLLRMNLAAATPPATLAALLHGFHPEALVVLYHDAGALARDAGAQSSLALAASLISAADLSPPPSGR